MGKHDMITSIGYREGSNTEPEGEQRFEFKELKKPLDDEIIDLKNDVLKLCEYMDVVQQGIINLNSKVNTKLDYQMKFIEKVNNSVNEVWLEIEKLVK